MIKIPKRYSVILLILFLGTLFHYKYINEFPSHTHAWAQSDRYALSLGFLNNNHNIFKPETFVMNHQFPHNMGIPYDKSITAVDFPIHDYIPAIIMKITGVSAPYIFRLYILLYSLIGLFFLFRLSQLLLNNYIKSSFILIFAATSPIFVYYQAGFLPTIPSLANAILGIYFFVKYLHIKKSSYFNLSILFLTLATLSRTTFAIPLIAVFTFELLRVIKKETGLRPKIIPVLISILIIISYYLYNNFLRNTYGSIFLNHFIPIQSIKQGSEIIKTICERWGTQYFSIVHWLVLLSLTLTSSFLFFYKRRKGKKDVAQIWILLSIEMLGCIAFSLLMLPQFLNHDYYFLDTFFLPLILLAILLASSIPEMNTQKSKNTYHTIILLVSILMIINAVYSQNNRHITGFWDRTNATINNFTGSDELLHSLDISEDSKMLVIDAYAPNIPFILMDRKGYAIMSTKKDNIENALTWDYDYIIIQNDFFVSDIYSTYPEILSKIKKVADNGKISICILSENKSNQSLLDFIGLEEKDPVFQAMISYDTIPNKYWHNTKSTSELSYSGSKSGVLTKDMQFGLTYKTNKLETLTEDTRILLFSSYFLSDTMNDCCIVVSISEKGKNTYYNSYNIKNMVKEKGIWQKVILSYQLPQIESSDYELGIYIWNTGKNDLFIDDFGFKIY